MRDEASRVACIENGGHFWPEDAPENEPQTCTNCGYNPSWVKDNQPDNTDSPPDNA